MPSGPQRARNLPSSFVTCPLNCRPHRDEYLEVLHHKRRSHLITRKRWDYHGGLTQRPVLLYSAKKLSSSDDFLDPATPLTNAISCFSESRSSLGMTSPEWVPLYRILLMRRVAELESPRIFSCSSFKAFPRACFKNRFSLTSGTYV